MPIIQYQRFTVAFQGSPPISPQVDQVGTDYRIEEAAGAWKVWENALPVAMTPEQHSELKSRLEALRPLPEPDIEPRQPGEDGTWCTISVSDGSGTQGYTWWGPPPPEWARLEAVIDYVESLADIPRQALAEQTRVVAAQYFDRLAARDVEGALACCAPQIEYSSPFFEGHFTRHGRVAVASMWRAWFQMLPDGRMVRSYVNAGPDHAFVDWTVEYTSLSGQKKVRQPRISASLSFAEGKITRHRDTFSLAEWVSHAYGVPGNLLGGQAMFQKWVAARERARLAAFEAASTQN